MQLSEETVTALGQNSVEVLRPDSRAPILLLCEHAGAEVPAPWNNLGLDRAFFETHYAFDPGVDALTRHLSAALSVPAVLTRYSRIFLDYNRFETDWDHMRPDLGGIPVPANQKISAEDHALRRAVARAPVTKAITPLQNRCAAVVSVHSFTPVMAGEVRDVDVGLMWRADSPFVRISLQELTRQAAPMGLRVGDNAPYDWRKVIAFSLQTHALDLGLPCYYIEVNNRLLSNPETSRQVADLLTRVLGTVIDRVAEWDGHAV